MLRGLTRRIVARHAQWLSTPATPATPAAAAALRPTLLNAYSNRKEELPLSRPLTWYTCGPTVYDDAHLGHGWTYVQVDLLHRALDTLYGIPVTHVRNITDIDDKIRAAAAARGVTPAALADTYIAAFERDMAALGVAPPAAAPRVTDNIAAIVAFVEDLVAKGVAYADVADGSVYFDTQAYGDAYPGAFFASSAGTGHSCGHAGESDGEPHVDNGSAAAGSANKRHAADFALWKGAATDGDAWDAPWGRGFPGWHIECSAMATKILGQTLDVHAGGIDLKFPHHTNEIAQTLAWLDAPRADPRAWASHFVHISHLHIDGAKMSKSLKNFITVAGALDSGAMTGNQFRLYAAMHSRSSPAHLDASLAETLSEARAIEADILAATARSVCATNGPDPAAVSAATAAIQTEWAHLMEDGLRTSRVVQDTRKRAAAVAAADDPVAARALLAALDGLGFSWTHTLESTLPAGAVVEMESVLSARARVRTALQAKTPEAITQSDLDTLSPMTADTTATPSPSNLTVGAGWALCDSVRDAVQAQYPVRVMDGSHVLWEYASSSGGPDSGGV